MTNAHPNHHIDLEEITARNQTARQIIAGFSTAMPTLAEIWQHLEAALADTPTLSAEITRLHAELTGTRLDRANLLAAIRATVGADAEGEGDPLGYLRDELDSAGAPASTRRRA